MFTKRSCLFGVMIACAVPALAVPCVGGIMVTSLLPGGEYSITIPTLTTGINVAEVAPSGSDCVWTLTMPSYVRSNWGLSGGVFTGTGGVVNVFTLLSNPSAGSRTAGISIAGQSFAIIEGGNPSGTPTKIPLLPSQKLQYGVTAAGFVAAALAAEAIALSPGCDVIPFCPGYYWEYASGLMQAAAAVFAMVKDPSDPNYAVIAVPNVYAFSPILPSGNLNQANADKLNAILQDLADTSAYSSALLTALNRTQGATDAGDMSWQTQQLISATTLARQHASFVNAQPSLFSGVVSAFTAWGVPAWQVTANDITALQGQIASQGLPSQVLTILQQQAANASTIADIKQLIAQADPSLAAGSYPADWTKFGQWTIPTSTALIAFASTAPSVPISADLNGDGLVDCTDVNIVKAAFGKTGGQVGFDVRADVNFDGVINIRDLAFISQKLTAGTVCH